MMKSMHTLGVDLTKVLVSQRATGSCDQAHLGELGTLSIRAAKAAASGGQGLFGALQLNLE